MADLISFISTVLTCTALVMINIILFGVIKRALEDKAILGEKEKEVVVVSQNDVAETETEDNTVDKAEEETEEITATEIATDSAEIAELATKVATLASEVSTFAAKKRAN